MEPIDILIDDIYIPAKHRRRTVDQKAVDELAENILEVGGLKAPILVRPDGARYVLVSGLHRLEACKALGEETISGLVVQSRKH
ncbi:MAG: ParB N-terminal domain-containing protein [Proteobacteria bacterium]|nr:ParB N-terminal domain-containing protein [Pseudomonadota bacterium]MCH8096981.1 ParB N-terminal domain-containing protein [Pseudomonadota bacterium]